MLWKIEQFPRQKSGQTFGPAKYPCMLALGLSACSLFIPVVNLFTWLFLAFFLWREKDSRFFRLQMSQALLLVLLLTIIGQVLRVAGQLVLVWARESKNQDALFRAWQIDANLNGVNLGLRILSAVYLISQMFFAFSYKMILFKNLGKWAVKLEENTYSGPLR